MIRIETIRGRSALKEWVTPVEGMGTLPHYAKIGFHLSYQGLLLGFPEAIASGNSSRDRGMLRIHELLELGWD